METNHKEFKPFDKVLIREEIFPKWSCDFYSHYDNDIKQHVTSTMTKLQDDDILPYEGNEHLVGTSDEPDEEVKLEEGEYIICFDDMECFNKSQSSALSLFKDTINYQFYTTDNQGWKYAIRFSDFNPSDMEETKKHILCVKNGKVVKYKG